MNPTYIHIAEETGGAILPALKGTDVAPAMALMKAGMWREKGLLLYAGDQVGGAPREFPIPIDSTVRAMILTVTVHPKGTIQLFTPSGRELQFDEANMKIANLSSGRIYDLVRPEKGVWRLRIEGADVFWAGVEAATNIDAYRAEFVRWGLRPGHEGLFPIQGHPLRGGEHILSAVMFGPFASARFKLISRAGRELSELDLKQGDPNADENEFVGKLTLPEEPFRVAVGGQDMEGRTYQRIFPRLFRAQTVEVGFVSLEGSGHPGETVVLLLQVLNIGSDSDFALAATSAGGAVEWEPSTLTLESGEKKTFTTKVTVPEGAKPFDRIEVIVTATSATDPCVRNRAVFNLEVPYEVEREPSP